MLKNILATILIFVLSLSTAFAAGSFYLGPAITYADVRSSDLAYNGILPGIYGGYGTWWTEWLNLALEGFVTTKSIQVNDDDADDADKAALKMNYNYGISVVPTVNLDDTIFAFARIGWVRTQFSRLQSINNAFQLGLGLEGVLTGCWNVRGGADYLTYSRVDNVGSIHAAEYTVALIYRFNSL